EHHEDLRDHRARSRVRDLRNPRRSDLEARRRLPTVLLTTLPHSLVILAALVVASSAAGCGAVGRSTTGDASRGKELFLAPKSQCASCHTLADGKSQGKLAPNLDDAFASDKSQGFDEQTIRDVVRGQIAYPEEPMPADLLEGKDADDVSAYIAKCAGNANCGVTASRSTPPPSGGRGGGTTTTTQGGGSKQPDG